MIILVITLFLPFFYNSGVASIYEYIEKRFGSKSRSVIALVFLVTQAFGSAAVLYATALVLQFITGIDVTTAIVVITLIALVYTSLGGISAVIWTDVIQAGILLVGSVIIFVALIGELPQPLLDYPESIEVRRTHRWPENGYCPGSGKRQSGLAFLL